MSEQELTPDERFPDSLVGLWNEKLALGRDIEELLKPFCTKYQLGMHQVQIECNNTGVYVRVTL